MSVMRNRPKGATIALFGLGLCFFAVLPTEVGYQDIASLLARQPGVAERWQKRVVASAVSSIQVATFSFGRPIGTSSRNPRPSSSPVSKPRARRHRGADAQSAGAGAAPL